MILVVSHAHFYFKATSWSRAEKGQAVKKALNWEKCHVAANGNGNTDVKNVKAKGELLPFPWAHPSS